MKFIVVLLLLFSFLNVGYGVQNKVDKKIIALSIPKAGTTLLRKAIRMITGKPVTSLGGKKFIPKEHLKKIMVAESHHLHDRFNPVLDNHLRDNYIKLIF